MSRFYGRMKGSRGEKTVQGHASGGLVGQIVGWDSGISVWAHDVDGQDVFEVSVNGGSNNLRSENVIARVRKGKVEYIK